MDISQIKKYFLSYNIEYVGTVPFSEVLPLIECRAIRRLPENPKTVIACLFPYYVGEYKNRNVSRYALGRDYHSSAGGILKEISEKLGRDYSDFLFVPFIDSSPIREVHTASLGGLGTIGKNNQLINEKYGTYTFIGCIVTNAVLTNDVKISHLEKCLGCEKCINSCPTGALSKGGFNRDICRSHITQKKGELTAWEREQIKAGGFVWGCDICSDVCPMNKNPILTPIKAMYDNIYNVITRENISEIISGKAFEYRGEKVIGRNIEILEQN